MARPVMLFTCAWSDLPLEELAPQAGEWAYQGLELCCWGDHFEVQRALSEADYCQRKLDLLASHELTVTVLNCQRVGHAVCGPIDERFQAILPDYVWGDGQADGVQERAEEEMIATAQAAEKLGASVLSGFTGSPLWSAVPGFPPAAPEWIDEQWQDFARRWNPILDVCRDSGVRFALEVQAGQIAFDLFSAESVLDALQGREEFGFTFNPAALHWQGVDPVEFLRRYPDRIYHVHFCDAALTLNGRTGILNSYHTPGHPRRGWDHRSPGHGGVDWEGVIRALHDIGYDGPLAVDWRDPRMDRDFGAEDACKFVKRLDFPTSEQATGNAFRDA